MALTNPLGNDFSLMRRSLLPGLLRAAAWNLARQEPSCRLFEAGAVYWHDAGVPRQENMVAGIVVGSPTATYWYDTREQPAGWVMLKRLVQEALGARLPPGSESLANETLAGTACTALTWRVGMTEVARLFRLPAAVARGYQINAPVWVVELWPGRWPPVAPTPLIMQPIPELPTIERDLALLVPAGLSAGQVQQWLAELRPDILDDFWMFDHYSGTGLPDGKVSLGFRFRFRHAARTLTTEEVDTELRRIFSGLQNRAAIELREGSVL